MTVTTPNYTVEIFARSNVSTPVATLNSLLAATFADMRKGPGTVEVTVRNADNAAIIADRLLRISIRGVPAVCAILDVPNVVTVDKAGDDALRTTAKGTGHLALWAEGRVLPPYSDRLAAGETLRPKVLDRLMDYRDPAFDPTGIFSPATVIRTQGNDPVPSEWRSGPDSVGVWTSDGDDAPAELRWFRSQQPGDTGEFVVPDGVSQVAVLLAVDNVGQPYLDGMHLTAEPGAATTSTIIVDVTPGYHLLAVAGQNLSGSSPNPAWAQLAVHEWVGGTHLGDLLCETSTDWLVSDATDPPSWNAVEAMQQLLTENQTLGKLTGLSVTAMGTFPTQTGIVAHVGDDLLAFLKYLNDAGYCDYRMDPGSLDLQMWPPTTMGTAQPATLQTPTDATDPLTGNLDHLEFDGEKQTATELLVDYPDGWRLVDATSPSGAEKLGLQRFSATDVSTVDSVAASVLALTASPRAQVSLKHAVHSQTPDVDHPYTGFVPGDTITVPAADGTPTVERVEQITGQLNVDNDFFEFDYDLGDVIAEATERQVQSLSNFVGGDIGGRSAVATPVDSSPSLHGQLPTPFKHVFDFAGDALTDLASHPVESSGLLCIGIATRYDADGVPVDTAASTTVDVSDTSGSLLYTIEIASGAVAGRTLSSVAVVGGVDSLIAQPTSTGSTCSGVVDRIVVELYVA